MMELCKSSQNMGRLKEDKIYFHKICLYRNLSASTPFDDKNVFPPGIGKKIFT